MFASRMQRTLSSPLLLLFLSVQLSLAQEQAEDDSTFSAIDYYSGRIVQGFGGGFGQKVSGKKFGVRSFSSLPFVYSNIGRRASLSFSNSTSWSQFDDSTNVYFGVLAKNTAQDNGASFRYRLASDLLLELGGDFSRSESRTATGFGTGGKNKGGGVGIAYYSQGGRIFLSPAQLAFQYYASAPRFLSPKQFMLNVRGSYGESRWETRLDSTAYSNFSLDKLYSRGLVLPSLQFAYSWQERLTVGFTAQSWLTKSELTRHDSQSEQNEDNVARITSFSPLLLYFSSEKLLHSVSFNLGRNDSKSETVNQSSSGNPFKAATEYNASSWSYSYSLQFLSAITSPTVEAFLADWKQNFGNRLPRGLLHLSVNTSGSFSEYENQRSDEQTTAFIVNDDDYRSSSSSLQGRYGLTNGLELQTGFNYYRYRNERWNYEPIVERTLQKSEQWSAGFSLKFANYRFEERYRARFGWLHLREYDRLYGPILLRGMLNGSVGVNHYKSFFHSIGKNYDNYYDYRSWGWGATASLRYGLLDNLELRSTARIGKSSFAEGNTYRAYQLACAWQPWHSIRLQISRSDNTPEYFATYHPSDMLWSFQITSLF